METSSKFYFTYQNSTAILAVIVRMIGSVLISLINLSRVSCYFIIKGYTRRNRSEIIEKTNRENYIDEMNTFDHDCEKNDAKLSRK